MIECFAHGESTEEETDTIEMLFALYDYSCYRRRTGKYSRDINRGGIMGRAFDYRIPDKALAKLRPGDFLFVETFGWYVSWLIMYLTSSRVSHAALYLGSKKIMHATLAGVCKEDIDVLFNADSRILPCITSMTDEQRKKVRSTVQKLEGIPYGFHVVKEKGLRIISGRDWTHFRWKFFADIALIVLVWDAPIYLVVGWPVLSWLIFLYLVLLAFNRLLSKLLPLPFNEFTGYPCQVLSRELWSGRGIFIMDNDLDGHSGDIILFRNFDAWISSLSRSGTKEEV